LEGIGGYSDVTSGRPAFFVFGKETLEGLLVRTPTQILFGVNWLHNDVLPLLVYCSLLGGTLLVLSFTTSSTQYRNLIWLAMGWILLAGIPAHSLLLVSPGLAGSRVYYLPAVGAALFVGSLLAGLEPAGIRWCWTTVIVSLMSLGLLHNLGAWDRASNLSQRTLQELNQLEPSPVVNTRFIMLGLPNRVDGVYFYLNGLPQAVRLTYRRPDLDAARGNDSGSKDQTGLIDPQLIRIQWIGADNQLLEVQ
jgi:hypothetical protein